MREYRSDERQIQVNVQQEVRTSLHGLVLYPIRDVSTQCPDADREAARGEVLLEG